VRQRSIATAAAAIGYVLLTLSGLALAPLPDQGSAPAEIRAFLADSSDTRYIIGICGLISAYLALVAFATGLARATWDSDGHPAWGHVAAGGAGFAAAMVGMGLAVTGGVVLQRASVDLGTAGVLLAVASVATWASQLGIAVMFVAFAVGLPGSGWLPRWTGWTAAGLGVMVAVSVPFARSDAAHLPALLVDVWLLVVAALLAQRSRRSLDPSGADEALTSIRDAAPEHR
jgi:hypothetical protein